MRVVVVLHGVAVVSYKINLLAGARELVVLKIHNRSTFLRRIHTKHISILCTIHTFENHACVLCIRPGWCYELVNKAILAFTRHCRSKDTFGRRNFSFSIPYRIVITEFGKVPWEMIVIRHHIACFWCWPILHIERVDDIIVALDIFLGDNCTKFQHLFIRGAGTTAELSELEMLCTETV